MRPEVRREQFKHLLSMPVRWGDVDRLGHVNNVQFLRYAEDARVTWVERMRTGLQQADLTDEGPILADIQCSFLRQLRWPAAVEIGARAERIGRSSMTLINPVFEAGQTEPVAIARAVIVWFDYKAQKSVPVPEPLRAAIRQFEVLAPEE
ncbi:MAG: acyl-CoA thioesterase [Nevskiales bacterium]